MTIIICDHCGGEVKEEELEIIDITFRGNNWKTFHKEFHRNCLTTEVAKDIINKKIDEIYSPINKFFDNDD